MTWGYCHDRAPIWAHQTAAEHVLVIPGFLWMLLPFRGQFSGFGGCGKNNLEAFFLPRQTSSQDTRRSNRSRMWNEELQWEMGLCNHCLKEAPGCQFSSPFVFSSSALLPLLLSWGFLPRICMDHVEWGKWFLVTLSVAWQTWFAAVVPAESWHHVKAFITGDMLIANLQKVMG